MTGFPYADVFRTPEPPPVRGEAAGPEITPALIEWLGQISPEVLEPRDVGFCIGAVEARTDYGRDKYKTVLRRDDGRDTSKESAQELADWLQYAHKLTMQVESGAVDVAELARFMRLNGPLIRAVWVLYIRITGMKHRAALACPGCGGHPAHGRHGAGLCTGRDPE